MTLSPSTIAAAKPGDILRDDTVPGLHLRVLPARKVFYLYYRTRLGEERRPKIGDYGVLTISEARRLARETLREVALGNDPAGAHKAARAGMTVGDVIAVYERERLPKKRAARSIKGQLAHIRHHLGKKKIATLALAEVETMFNKISETAPGQANKVVGSVSVLLNLAERLDARPLNSNFCKLIERNKENRRHRYLDPSVEAAAVGAALHKRLYGPQHEAALFIFLLLLTGARKGEIGHAKAVDIVGNVLIVRDHKTREKIGEKVVRLPKIALDLLNDPRRPRHAREGYLVGVADPRKLWAAIRTEIEGLSDLRIHDLRHAFASFGLAADVGIDMIAELLAHRSTQTTKGYTHLIQAPADNAVNRIADTVADALKLERKEAA